MADAKDRALAIGAHLADLETKLGQIAGMVMQAAVYNEIGVAETAAGMAEKLRPEISELESLIDLFVSQLRK